jgi:dimeric dUTPase (all-alpha-NTP-PPase superfamily)
MEDRLVSMLRQQRELQHRMGNLFFRASADDRAARVEHIKNMALAAIKEIGEALDETSWKPWTTGKPFIRKHAVSGELSDAFQFIMNMWFTAYPELSDEELADRMISVLEAKLAINESRRVSGYDGISTKCPDCKRALDDPAVSCTANGCNLRSKHRDTVAS